MAYVKGDRVSFQIQGKTFQGLVAGVEGGIVIDYEGLIPRELRESSMVTIRKSDIAIRNGDIFVHEGDIALEGTAIIRCRAEDLKLVDE